MKAKSTSRQEVSINKKVNVFDLLDIHKVTKHLSRNYILNQLGKLKPLKP